MTNQQVPEALRLADSYAKAHAMYCMEDLYGTSKSYTAELLKERHAARERLADAMVEAQHPATHVQNPAEIEHVAGDVSKNGTESNVSTQQQECGNTPYDEGPFALAQPAAQQGAAYAALPEKYYLAGGEVPTWDAKQMHAFADRTHALRAPHGQAPAGAGEAAGREPLTEEQRSDIATAAAGFNWTDDYVEAIDYVIDGVESLHGIKGVQHGAE